VILLLCIVLALLLPEPWNVVVLLLGIVLEIGEIVWGRRLARRFRAQTGTEAAVGKLAEVIEPCAPDGVVRFQGETWQAHSSTPAGAGETVRIVGVRGLVLEVEPSALLVRRSPHEDEVETHGTRLG
jgi:membrane-bound serine protease (ClpP class)